MRRSHLANLTITLLAFATGVYFYPQMPERLASHWNSRGEADGYMPKLSGLFLMPLISLGLILLLAVFPRIDPMKANVEKFRRYYDMLGVVLVLFLLYLYLLTVCWNLGIRFNMNQLLAPAFAVLFYYVGVLIGKAKRNWFVGIRTPWTLSDDRVWDKTHQMGGRLFKIAGVLSFSGVLFPDYAILFILAPAISVSLYAVVYSYFEYRREASPHV